MYLVSQYSSHHKAYEGSSYVLCLAHVRMYLLHKHANQLEIIIKKLYFLNALGTYKIMLRTYHQASFSKVH